MTHVRCKVMYRCVCARHCAVETDTQKGYRQRADNKQTTWDPTLLQQSSCYSRMTAVMRSRHTSARLPREYESPSPDHRETHRSCGLFSDTATCCTFINVFVTKPVIPWCAHPDSHLPSPFPFPCVFQFHHLPIRSQARTDPPQVSFTGYCFSLDCGQLNCNLLSVEADLRPGQLEEARPFHVLLGDK